MITVYPTSKQQRLKLHKIPFMTYLEPEQKRALSELSARTGVPQARYVRDGISLILRQLAAPIEPSDPQELPAAR
jgi:hypothetical protein